MSQQYYTHKNKKSGAAKLINIKSYVVKEKIWDQIINLKHISIKRMLTDSFTKGLPPNVFYENVADMDLRKKLWSLDTKGPN
jgi:NADPH-dependent curcumin reductase CurA